MAAKGKPGPRNIGRSSIANSCPMCGKTIIEEDPSKHRCDVNTSDILDYSWIKVKKYVDDESLSWEERYKRLLEHHEKETNFLINNIDSIAETVHFNACNSMMYACEKLWNVDMINKVYPPHPRIDKTKK